MTAASAHAAPGMRYGFASGSYSSDLRPADGASLSGGASATLWRADVEWSSVEWRKGRYAWSRLDAMYAAMRARGIAPILMVWSAPNWVKDPLEAALCLWCRLPPADSQLPSWQDFVRRLAVRYPEAAAIQVWNEPNIKKFWKTPQGADPARYTRLLRAAYRGVRQANGSMPVITAGLIDVDPSPGNMTVEAFLEGMYRAGAQGNYTGLGFHPYPAQMSPEQGSYFDRMMGRIRAVRARYGDSTPLWLTEFGYFTGIGAAGRSGIAEQTQARWLECGYRRAYAMPDVDAFIVHMLRDTGANAAVPEQNFGVVRHSLAPKSAYRQLQDMFASGRATQGLSSCDAVPSAG